MTAFKNRLGGLSSWTVLFLQPSLDSLFLLWLDVKTMRLLHRITSPKLPTISALIVVSFFTTVLMVNICWRSKDGVRSKIKEINLRWPVKLPRMPTKSISSDFLTMSLTLRNNLKRSMFRFITTASPSNLSKFFLISISGEMRENWLRIIPKSSHNKGRKNSKEPRKGLFSRLNFSKSFYLLMTSASSSWEATLRTFTSSSFCFASAKALFSASASSCTCAR